jgi:hypothetical protein
MSEETVPEQGRQDAHPLRSPTGLVQQMEELVAALNAGLAGLDTDLRFPRRRNSAPAPYDTRSV